MIETACIALGSNLDDRRGHITAAINDLRRSDHVEVVAASRLFETDPVGPADQGKFLNAAAVLKTALTPRDLLDRCLAIEAAHGRDRHATERWGPRTLDIDLLLYGDHIIDEPGLQVPHPRMLDREFVLRPLASIAPLIVHPQQGKTIEWLLTRLVAGVHME